MEVVLAYLYSGFTWEHWYETAVIESDKHQWAFPQERSYDLERDTRVQIEL